MNRYLCNITNIIINSPYRSYFVLFSVNLSISEIRQICCNNRRSYFDEVISTLAQATIHTQLIAHHGGKTIISTRHMPAHEAHSHATDTQIKQFKARGSGRASALVQFVLSKGMTPDSCNGTDRLKFSVWEPKMSNFLSAGDCRHAETFWNGFCRNKKDVIQDEIDLVATRRSWSGHARDHARCARYLFIVLSNNTSGQLLRRFRSEKKWPISCVGPLFERETLGPNIYVKNTIKKLRFF